MKNSSKLKLTIVLMVSLMVSSVIYAQKEQTENDKFYRGAYDNDIVAAPNGASVNSSYLDYMSSGAYAGIQVIEVTKGVWTVVGYSLSNYTFIEGKTGLIAFDAGNNMGTGQEVLDLIQEKIDKPIVALIYSHFHYTGGAKAYAASNPTGKIPVYGHPDVDKNMAKQTGTLRMMQNRRAGIQFGLYLPHKGPDASFIPAEPYFTEPALNAKGHLPVTKTVEDGESLIIDGINFTFYHIVSDTRDGVIAYIPEMDVALHNTAAINTLFSLYSLRGDYYRNPVEMIQSIDKIRSLNPKYVIGCHGMPLVGDEVQENLTAHRDAYAFTYNQSVRLINKGKSPEEMVESIQLPKHLTEYPDLYQAYVDHEYNVRGQYRGIVGWYGEEIADLHPPKSKELGQEIIEMAGGVDKVIAKSEAAFDTKKYNLSAKLISYVLAVEPENKEAKQLKANALRQMAYTTKTGIQSRNFILTSALHLEGKIDMNKAPKFLAFGSLSTESIMANVPGSSIKMLEINVDPERCVDLNEIIELTFSGLQKTWNIHVRKGVVEVSEALVSNPSIKLNVSRQLWAELIAGSLQLDDFMSNDFVEINGDINDFKAVFGSFDTIKN